MKLSDLLLQVDLYYLTFYLSTGMTEAAVSRVAAEDQLTGGPMGGGIWHYAKEPFRYWVDTAREAMGAIPRDPENGVIDVTNGQAIPTP